MTETIIKTEAIRYNVGKPQFSLVDYGALIPMIRVLEFGAKKYARNNWRKGLSKENLLDSMMRHVGELIDAVNTGGDELDHESQIHLIGHIMCNAMFYSKLYVENKEQNGTT
jgi:hypothetical protein